ncbi:hypothetical protein [Rossellomorea aquimaris]|uniref:hypothetical protein n=1 Tax=Rossellomorea aquimaris TaxID=189382 RepID=UPI0011E918B8|nr:hypothetical protein [Rossellomorea aquimaris]TYS89953.1 hypothetical protein FZC88_10250 [Rossellomorea aquimaris]
MKKLLFILSATLLLLAACNSEETINNEPQPVEKPVDEEVQVEDTSTNEPPVEEPEEVVEEEVTEEAIQEVESPEPLTEEKIKEIIDYYSIGEGDVLSDVSVVDGEIKATIDLAPNEMFSGEDMAVNRYSQLSDELLNHEGWEILTITYSNIGTVSMNRMEKETNDYGDYFPTLTIEERLR